MSASRLWPTCRVCKRVAVPAMRCPALLEMRCPFALDAGRVVGEPGAPPEEVTPRDGEAARRPV